MFQTTLSAIVAPRLISKKIPAWEQEAVASGVAHMLSLVLDEAGRAVNARFGPYWFFRPDGTMFPVAYSSATVSAIVQRAALKAADERRQLRELIEADEAVTSRLSADQLAACFDIDQMLRNVETIIDRLKGEAANVVG